MVDVNVQFSVATRFDKPRGAAIGRDRIIIDAAIGGPR
jgi:hypothetical protein